MSDARQRELERQAHNDPHAAQRLKHQRCRSGQCCGHAAEVPADVEVTANYRNGHDLLSYLAGEDVDEDTGETAVQFVLSGPKASREAVVDLLVAAVRALHPDPAKRVCTFCKAQPGEKCVTKSGKTRREMHAVRMEGTRPAIPRLEERLPYLGTPLPSFSQMPRPWWGVNPPGDYYGDDGYYYSPYLHISNHSHELPQVDLTDYDLGTWG